MHRGKALSILREELERAGTSTEYDFTVKDDANDEAANFEWWRPTDDGLGDTPRNKAYFRAYIRIANSGQAVKAGTYLRVRGLRLSPKGRLWMDRYVIGKMHQRGFLEFDDKPEGMFEPVFIVTPAGEEWANP